MSLSSYCRLSSKPKAWTRSCHPLLFLFSFGSNLFVARTTFCCLEMVFSSILRAPRVLPVSASSVLVPSIAWILRIRYSYPRHGNIFLETRLAAGLVNGSHQSSGRIARRIQLSLDSVDSEAFFLLSTSPEARLLAKIQVSKAADVETRKLIEHVTAVRSSRSTSQTA